MKAYSVTIETKALLHYISSMEVFVFQYIKSNRGLFLKKNRRGISL